jgi:tripeptide aminopeptidase
LTHAADHVDATSAEAHLLRFLAVDGVTGEEKAIAEAVIDELIKVGVPKAAIRFDDAHTRIPLPTQTGNLIVDLPATAEGPHLLFSTHLDTVPLCRGAKPKVEGRRAVSDGTTALGGDNRTGCGVLVTLAETLIKHKLPHPKITLLFTVREESGLHGARELNPRDLGGPVMCINVDSEEPQDLITGAVGQENWEVEIKGRASHAGLAPEKGISATLVGALGLANARRDGWFGKVEKGSGKGTSNVGIFGGQDGKAAGDATNVVTDYAFLRGEARSPELTFAGEIAEAFGRAFEEARQAVTAADGAMAEVKYTRVKSYPPFNLAADAPAVHHAMKALEALGIAPNLVFSHGGLDANWLDKHGIPTVTIGAGQREVHTVKEYVELDEYVTGCRIAVMAATLAS